MRSLICLAMLACATMSFAEEELSVPEHLQKVAATVRAQGTQGSGTIVTRKVEGDNTPFILTAHHVIDGLRKVHTNVKNGKEEKHITYGNAQIVQEKVLDGQTVGESVLHCKVVATSPKFDIAVLEVLWTGYYDETHFVVFPLDDTLPRVGTELYHCGSPSGQELGHNSVTPGIVAANGRMFNGLPYIQSTTAALPGSSGGLVVEKETGNYVGMLTLGIRGTDSFNYLVPSRRIVEWAKDIGFEYLVNPDAKAVTRAELDQLPIESNGDYVSREDKEQVLDESGAFFWVIDTDCGPTPAPVN